MQNVSIVCHKSWCDESVSIVRGVALQTVKSVSFKHQNNLVVLRISCQNSQPLMCMLRRDVNVRSINVSYIRLLIDTWYKYSHNKTAVINTKLVTCNFQCLLYHGHWSKGNPLPIFWILLIFLNKNASYYSSQIRYR